MFRPSTTSRLARASVRSSTRASPIPNHLSRRYLTTEPPHKTSRSWKNSATRWALAIGGVYWYNTTPLFAEQPHYTVQNQEAPLPTLDSLSRSSRFAPPSDQDLPVLPVQPSANSPPSLDPKSGLPSDTDSHSSSASASALESEAEAQGAFNEETGEINWDCPCLGGMAHGPCGPEFREAFSCFVYSKEEPKGMDCVDKFKGMQECFRAHPEEYGDQLDEDEEEIERELAAREAEEGELDGGLAAARSSAGNEGEGGVEISAAVGEGVKTAVKEEVKQDASAGGFGIGGDASKALTKDDKAKKEEVKARQAPATKRSIYDSDSESDGQTRSSKTNDTGKASPNLAGDESGDLVPKAAHDATGAGVKS